MVDSTPFVRDPDAPGEGLDTRPSDRSPGMFLGRLWTLFGEPDEVTDTGFAYGVRDVETGVRFTAYSGSSGPAFGGEPRRAAEAEEVLHAFDRLLRHTAPSDCSVTVEFDRGSLTIGVRGGDAFERLDTRD